MKLGFFTGKIYSLPQKRKTKSGKEIINFSLGISNSYKKNGELIKLPMTFIEFVVFNDKLFDKINSISLKEDIVHIIANIDNIEELKDGKRTSRHIYSALRVYKNSKNFYPEVIKLFNIDYEEVEDDTYNPDNVFTDKGDDLPF